MLFPKYVLEDLSVDSGSIIGKSNIEEFFNHISMHKDVEDKSLAELAPNYEVASAYLVHMLEARFASLNHFMQHMFLKLHDIEDSKKKDFILETLRREFRDVAIEARKVFEHFNMLGSPVKFFGTTKEDFKVPIPCKLVGMHEALEKKLIGFVLKIFLMKVVYQNVITRDPQKLIWTQFNLLLKRLLQLILMLLLKILDLHLSAPSSKALNKSILGR
jgi:hypothetical protein